jgi:nucleoside-diphosphate-sugar epimerase
MRVLITGICGFAGSSLARSLLEHLEGLSLFGVDNLSRAGSETNLEPLRALGCRVQIADLRDPRVLQEHEAVDWLIDAAANPSVLAGLSAASPSRELMDTNLVSTLPMLEFCRQHGAVFTLLSTSRVYGIRPFARHTAGGSLGSVPSRLRGWRLFRRHPRVVLHHPAAFALRRFQTLLRDLGSGIRRGIRFSGLD